mmetsp:Transcript_49500/g.133183  ORF Transcript_49500/g.133183 Transcript_49500/m.133183 type:complete len:226 (-) Transcript_49500:479-1156(-)
MPRALPRAVALAAQAAPPAARGLESQPPGRLHPGRGGLPRPRHAPRVRRLAAPASTPTATSLSAALPRRLAGRHLASRRRAVRWRQSAGGAGPRREAGPGAAEPAELAQALLHRAVPQQTVGLLAAAEQLQAGRRDRGPPRHHDGELTAERAAVPRLSRPAASAAIARYLLRRRALLLLLLLPPLAMKQAGPEGNGTELALAGLPPRAAAATAGGHHRTLGLHRR